MPAFEVTRHDLSGRDEDELVSRRAVELTASKRQHGAYVVGELRDTRTLQEDRREVRANLRGDRRVDIRVRRWRRGGCAEAVPGVGRHAVKVRREPQLTARYPYVE